MSSRDCSLVRAHLLPVMKCPLVLVLSRLDCKLWRADGSLDVATAPAGPPWAGSGFPLNAGLLWAERCFHLPLCCRDSGSQEGEAACLTAASPRLALTPGLCFPSPADVTSPGGEPGWKKEPPSGFREPDLSPGKTDTERLTQKPCRRHDHHHTTIIVNRTILNPET